MDIDVAMVEDGIARMTLRRPAKLNALTWTMIDDIHGALDAIGRDASVRVLVVTGEGRGFCSGIDLDAKDRVGTNAEVVEAYDRQERVAGVTLALRALPQPVIGAINGPAAGGGMAIALACDIRVCARSARFNVAFVRIGLSGADVGMSHLLPRIVGLGMASELMLTGRQVAAEEALRIGLANRVVDDAALLDEAVGLAREIRANSSFGVRMTKQVLHRNVDAPSLEAAIELENRTQVLTIQTPGMREALAAFRKG